MVRGGAHKKVTIFWQQAILILANEKKRKKVSAAAYSSSIPLLLNCTSIVKHRRGSLCSLRFCCLFAYTVMAGRQMAAIDLYTNSKERKQRESGERFTFAAAKTTTKMPVFLANVGNFRQRRRRRKKEIPPKLLLLLLLSLSSVNLS